MSKTRIGKKKNRYKIQVNSQQLLYLIALGASSEVQQQSDEQKKSEQFPQNRRGISRRSTRNVINMDSAHMHTGD